MQKPLGIIIFEKRTVNLIYREHRDGKFWEKLMQLVVMFRFCANSIQVKVGYYLNK